MKLQFFCFTLLTIIIYVDCGLVKNFFGNVKEDVHSVVDGTVNLIGKGTHKLTEGLGVFLHRKEGNKFSGSIQVHGTPNNQNIPNNYGGQNGYNPNDNAHTGVSENHPPYYNDIPTPVSNNVHGVQNNGGSYNHDDTSNNGADEDQSLYHNPKPTSVTVDNTANGVNNNGGPKYNHSGSSNNGVNENQSQYFNQKPTPVTVDNTDNGVNYNGGSNYNHNGNSSSGVNENQSQYNNPKPTPVSIDHTSNGGSNYNHGDNVNVGINEDNSHYNNPVELTPATVEQTSVNGPHYAQNGAHYESVTESTINNDAKKHETTNYAPTTETNINDIKQHEPTTEKTINHPVTESTTTEEAWFNGAELENILPNMIHNGTHFMDNVDAVNDNRGSYTDTNELGTGDLPNTLEHEDSNNKTAKCDDGKATETPNGSKVDLVSDQMFFKDNKPKTSTEANQYYVCSEGLVRAANGDCLEPVKIDIRKKDEPKSFSVFIADNCASGYARAHDGTCQPIVG